MMSVAARLEKLTEIHADAKAAMSRLSVESERINRELPSLRSDERKLRVELNEIRMQREAREARQEAIVNEMREWQRREASSASDIQALTALLDGKKTTESKDRE